jgi:uncharacterized cupredoxin-like copper-binding protein
MTQMNRRKLLATSIVAAPAVLVTLGVRAAQDSSGTPDAVASPGASPSASPMASPGASPAAGGTSLQLSAIDINWDPKTLTLPADTDVDIVITNNGMLPHDFAVDELSIMTEEIPSGGEITVTINAPAGTYEYYCAVPGHKEAGMVGTLTVQ